jgi:heme/copper-type cytochrome/quinol oxidase subunit 2
MVNSVFEWLMIVLVILFYLIVVIGIIAAFWIPILNWEERQKKRKRENKSITKWDYAQEMFLTLISPIVLSGLGVLYLVDLFDLKF